jgi:hypothetical protein
MTVARITSCSAFSLSFLAFPWFKSFWYSCKMTQPEVKTKIKFQNNNKWLEWKYIKYVSLTNIILSVEWQRRNLRSRKKTSSASEATSGSESPAVFAPISPFTKPVGWSLLFIQEQEIFAWCSVSVCILGSYGLCRFTYLSRDCLSGSCSAMARRVGLVIWVSDLVLCSQRQLLVRSCKQLK